MSSVLEAVEENSRSRSGKHILRSLIYIYSREKGLTPLSKIPHRIVKAEEIPKTYRIGEARRLLVGLRHGEFLIQARFIKNFQGRVKGEISVYNYRGELVYKAKYVDGELRRSMGNPVYAWIVRLFASELRIPVKKTRLGDENH